MSRALAVLLMLVSQMAVPAALEAQFADSVVAVPMGGNVYMLQGAGDVIAVSIGEDGILLVDVGFPQTEAAVRVALAQLADGEPRYVINTHWHHAGANPAFADAATIIAHRAARQRLLTGSLMYTQEMPPAPAEALPDLVVDDSASIFFNGEEIKLIHLPRAHTDGDLAVLFTESRVAALGDVFVTLIPVTDYPSGGDLYDSLHAVEYLLERLPPDTRIVPGHGRSANDADLRAFHEMLSAMIRYVEEEIDAGRSVDEVIAAGIPERWVSWLELIPAEFVLANLYEGVTRSRADRIP